MKVDRRKVYLKYSGHCAYCGKIITIEEMQVDHIHPQFLHYHLHGTGMDINDYENLNPSCRYCNKWKSTHKVEEFRHEIKMQIERLRKYSASFRLAEKYSLIRETGQDVVFYFEKHPENLGG
jgi:5-methylcytosine-specific restriction endonuclease McrA